MNSKPLSRRIVDQMKIEEQKNLNDQKERMLMEQSEMNARHDNEKRDYQNKYEKEIKDLSEKLEDFMKNNTEL